MVCLAVSLGLLAIAPPSTALSLGGIGIRPERPTPEGWFTYQLRGGQQASDAVVVINGTDQQQVVQLAAVDYEPTEIGAFGLKRSNSAQTGIGQWVKLSTTELTLAPGQSRRVPFTLIIPADVTAGEYAGAITAQGAPTRTSSGAVITTRVAVRIYNTVPGALVKQARVLRLTMLPNPARGQLEVTVTVENEGNVSLPVTLGIHWEGFSLMKVIRLNEAAAADTPPVAALVPALPFVLESNRRLPAGAAQEALLLAPQPYLGRAKVYATLTYDGEEGREVQRSPIYLVTALPWSMTVRPCDAADGCR